MFCSNCGASFPDTASFCPKCGKKVSVARPASPQAPVTGATQQPAQQAGQDRSSQPTQVRPQLAPSASQAPAPAAGHTGQMPAQQVPQPQAQPWAQQQVQSQPQPQGQGQAQGQPWQQAQGQYQAQGQSRYQSQQQAQTHGQAQGQQQVQGQPQVQSQGQTQAQQDQTQAQARSQSPQQASQATGGSSSFDPSKNLAVPVYGPPLISKKRKLVPIIAAALAVLLAIAGGIFFFRGRAGGGEPEVAPSVSEVELSSEVRNAMDDAASIGEELVSESDIDSESDQTVDFDSYLTRLASDREVVQGAMKGADADTKAALARADRAIENIEADVKFLNDILTWVDEFSSSADGLFEDTEDADQFAEDLGTLYNVVEEKKKELQAIDVPENLKQPVDMLANDGMGQLETSLRYSAQSLYGATTGAGIYTLALFESDELFTWTGVKVQQATDLLIEVFNEDVTESVAVLRGTSGTATEFTCQFVDDISPNLYPSMDSVVNIFGKTRSEKQDVMIEVEVAGFTQKWSERVTMEQGVSFYMIKPSLLPNNQLSDLTKEQSTQISLTITDVATGEVLVKKSEKVKLKSIYSMTWENDEFGATASFDILAWMRPSADEVDAVNRKANDYMQEWSGSPMAGYQFGDKSTYTMLQVAAIQCAINDYGVRYQMDSYSLTAADQNVLTPDAVIKKKQGLCIETTLLMASCLKRMDMHPVIIITPGHAQCAVETYYNSGNYFLVETTCLPYEVNTSYDFNDPLFYNGLLALDSSGQAWTTAGDAEEWAEYLSAVYYDSMENGGIFIIDCNLMDEDELNIRGIDA